MPFARRSLHLGWIAGVIFALAVTIAATQLPDYAHAQHSVGLLGSALHPRPWGVNIFGFGAAGISLAGFAMALEHRLAPLPRSGRIATGLVLISGLAFAAQGLFPLDPNDLDGPPSGRHAASHGIAMLAWAAGLALLAVALRGRRDWAAVRAFAALGSVTMLAWLLAPVGSTFTPGWSERLQWGAFFAWPAFAALVALRRVPPQSL